MLLAGRGRNLRPRRTGWPAEDALHTGGLVGDLDAGGRDVIAGAGARDGDVSPGRQVALAAEHGLHHRGVIRDGHRYGLSLVVGDGDGVALDLSDRTEGASEASSASLASLSAGEVPARVSAAPGEGAAARVVGVDAPACEEGVLVVLRLGLA